MTAHTLRGSWTLAAVPCCSATGVVPAEEEEESWKHTRGDRSELKGGSCPREEKGKKARSGWSPEAPVTDLTLQPSKFSRSTCLGGLLITFFSSPLKGVWRPLTPFQVPSGRSSESHSSGLHLLGSIALCLTWKKAVEGGLFLFLELELLVLVLVKENPDKTFHVTKHKLT